MKNINRLIEYDITKCIAIFLVLWGHSIQHLSVYGKSSNVFAIISLFHMPLFMLISGFFASRSMDLPIKTLVYKKAKQLLYPCLSFGIIFLIITLLCSLFQTDNLSLSIVVCSKYLYGIFWFLKSLFACYIISFFLIKITKNLLLGGGVAICLSQFLPLFKINWMMPFFVAGLILSRYFYLFLKYKKALAYTSTIIFIILSIFLIDSSKTWPDIISQTKIELLTGNISFIKEYFILQIERFAVGLSGSLMVLFSIFSISNVLNSKKVFILLGDWGKETLGIYIIQTLLLETILVRIIDFSNIDYYLFIYIISPITALIILYVCYLISNGISKSNFLKKILYL